jgi:hypothetical protein
MPSATDQRANELRIVVFISLDAGGKLQGACESPTLSINMPEEAVIELLRLVGACLQQVGAGTPAKDVSLDKFG